MATLVELYTSGDVVPLSTGTTFPETRALWASADGTATITTAKGQIVADITIKAGQNPFRITAITFSTISIWALR
jgi:hypothetical protein